MSARPGGTEAIEKDGQVVQALRSRRQVILDNIRDNDEAEANYRKDIEENEKQRCQLQNMIDEAIGNNGNRTYLRILSQYRLLGMANIELQFEMAMRDQVINNQREAQQNLWNLIMGLGLDQRQIMDLADKQGITIEDWTVPSSVALSLKESPTQTTGRSPIWSCPGISRPYTSTACIAQHHQDFSSMACFNGQWDGHSVCQQGHHGSYLMPHDHSPSAYWDTRKRNVLWAQGNCVRCCFSPEKGVQDSCCSYPMVQPQSHPWNEERCVSVVPFHEGFAQLRQDAWQTGRQQLPRLPGGSGSSFNLFPGPSPEKGNAVK
ncbi:hypothetical protein ACLOJK_036137 [Asimina triloba]